MSLCNGLVTATHFQGISVGCGHLYCH